MSDKDFDLDKILSESFSRLDKLNSDLKKETLSDSDSLTYSAKGQTSAAQPKQNDVLEQLSESLTAKPDLQKEDMHISEENSDGNNALPEIDTDLNADDRNDDHDTFVDDQSDDFDEGVKDDEPELEQSFDEGSDESPDEDYQEEPYDDIDDGDDDFVEEYTDVSPRKNLMFNMRGDENEHKKKKKKKVKPNNSVFTGALITVIVVSISFILAFSAIQLGVEYMGLTRSDETITFDIPEGTTRETAADLLYQKGIIGNPSFFKTVMKISGKTDVVAGSITLSPNMTYPSIISALVRSRRVYETVTVTFTEGMSLYKAAKLLEEKQVCAASDFIAAFNENSGFDFEKDLDTTPQTLYKMEGFLFPDTYEFYVQDDPANVVTKIKTNFESKMGDEVMKLVEQSGLSLYEVITLASIVQAEGDTETNMKLISSVFLNRLSDPSTYPHLESDSTYFYVTNTIASALGNNSVSSYESLYNTYTCFGLPIGPIGNPGMQAILAVLEPETTDYYFFVTDSVTGEYYYASTYEQHKINCEKAGY